MFLWVLGELALRRGLGPLLAPPLGSPIAADMALIAVGFPVLAGVLAWVGRRHGIDRPDWDYEFSAKTVGLGVAGVVAYFVALVGVLLVMLLVGFDPETGIPAGVGTTAMATWVVALLLVVNGVVVPIAEELAWRGVIQTALMDSWGVLAGSAVAATGFVLKHVIVDMGAPPIRLASLVILAVIFSALRARWGTGASTVAHLGANLLATGMSVVTL